MTHVKHSNTTISFMDHHKSRTQFPSLSYSSLYSQCPTVKVTAPLAVEVAVYACNSPRPAFEVELATDVTVNSSDVVDKVGKLTTKALPEFIKLGMVSFDPSLKTTVAPVMKSLVLGRS